jgi:hypothetical protein
MQESIKNLDKYLENIAIEVIKIGKEIKELKDQYENKYKDIPDKNYHKRNERPTCHQYNNKGHFTKECTSDKIEKDRMICYRCNKKDHYAKDC